MSVPMAIGVIAGAHRRTGAAGGPSGRGVDVPGIAHRAEVRVLAGEPEGELVEPGPPDDHRRRLPPAAPTAVALLSARDPIEGRPAGRHPALMIDQVLEADRRPRRVDRRMSPLSMTPSISAARASARSSSMCVKALRVGCES